MNGAGTMLAYTPYMVVQRAHPIGDSAMVTNSNRPRPADSPNGSQLDQPQYVFKPAKELPISKPDYVVQSPTPLGLRSVPSPKKDK